MFNYSKQIEAFRDEKIRLSTAFKQKLYDHRGSNRTRLINRLPERIEGLTIAISSFKPQGSMANDTIIQTTFIYDEYDMDDGLVLKRDELVDEDGNELTPEEVREHVLQSLKDKRFAKQPTQVHNCVRVFYKEEDQERHHVDFPVYRRFLDDDGNIIRELAGGDGWLLSDPTQVNQWFLDKVSCLNELTDGWGTQFRRFVQLMKRFARSRNNWDLPNGMKLTMLVYECLPHYEERIDIGFRNLLEAIEVRLKTDKVIKNLAHPDQSALTRTDNDANVEELEDKVSEALEKLEALDESENNNRASARYAWDWIFRSDGFFKELDDETDQKAKEASLREKVELLKSGKACTSSLGVIGASGVTNPPHRFYGDEFQDTSEE